MFKKIKITNFYSIGEEQEISFEINSKDKLDNSAVRKNNETFLNLVSCVIGPNASGKTTVLKAISFLFWFINESYGNLKKEAKIPISQHKLKGGSTKIEIEFYEEETLYKYLIELNQDKVLRERLDKTFERISNVFESGREGDNFFIKANHFKINEADELRFKERPNISLLSCLIETGYLPEILFFKKFKTNVNKFGTTMPPPFSFVFWNISIEMQKDEDLYQKILQFSKEVDLGILDFQFDNILVPQGNIQEMKTFPLLQCIHSTKDGQFRLPIFEESNGTKHNIHLLFEILPILKSGGLVIIDEIESGIHPFLAKKIISLFEDKKSNPNQAQLFFSTHQHSLLNDRTKTQIFIAEKEKSSSETEIYRLDDIEGVRNDENFFHKYLAGTYGGIPRVNPL